MCVLRGRTVGSCRFANGGSHRSLLCWGRPFERLPAPTFLPKMVPMRQVSTLHLVGLVAQFVLARFQRARFVEGRVVVVVEEDAEFPVDGGGGGRL